MSKQKNQSGDTANALYSVNEKVLCFHGPLLYEAKVLKIALREADPEKDRDGDPEAKREVKKEEKGTGIKEICYWVHYSGWSKKWDEWVPERRVLRFNEDNMAKQTELSQMVSDKGGPKSKKVAVKTPLAKKKSIGGDSASVTLSTTDSRSSTPVQEIFKKGKSSEKISEEEASRRKKRSENVEKENYYEVKQEIHIPIPDSLKLFLVDDWDFITRQKRLVNIPARHTVDKICDDYLNHVKEQNEDEDAAKDLIVGIKEYFNVMIGTNLLYRYERQQFLDAYKDSVAETEESKQDSELPPQPSALYGAAHLLRLFTRIGGAVAYTTLDQDAVALLVKCLDKFLKFMEANAKEYFSVDDYGAAPPEYQRKVPA